MEGLVSCEDMDSPNRLNYREKVEEQLSANALATLVHPVHQREFTLINLIVVAE